MAELNVGSLEMIITADGSAAITEIEKVGDAAQGMAEDVTAGMEDAEDALGGLGESADAARDDLEGVGKTGKSAGEEIDKGAKRASKSIREVADELNKAGEKATKFVTLPIVGALTASVNGASNLAETVSKTGVVFDDLSERVMAWSEKSVAAMGLAQGSALEYASTYGDMGKGMGLTLTQATDMAMSLTQLAADMSSFKNIRTDLAAQKLNAVYTGETEGLKDMGIVMTQTNLKAFALAQGIEKPIDAMNQAERVMLRYQYVMNATKDAQGDFARTGDSLANQTRKLGETIKQAGEAFGSQLIPMITPVVETFQKWVQHIAELDERTKNIIISIALTAAASGPLLLIGGKLLTFIATLKTALAALSINPVMLAIAAVAAAGLAIAGLNDALNRANNEAGEASEAFQRMKSSIEKGAQGKVSMDTEQLDALIENPPRITITADGQKALDKAAEIADEIGNGEYDGKLAIDGDPEKAEQVIAQLSTDIQAVRESITIDADGSAVIGDEGLVKKIHDDIAALEGVVVITEDPAAKQALTERLDALRSELGTLTGSITIHYNDEAEQKYQAFKQQLDGLEDNGTYSVTGEFVYPDASKEAIEEYRNALAEAATATGEYAEAVDQLNKVADQESQRKITEVQKQGNEKAMEQARLLNSGIIDRETYDAEIQRIVEDMTAEIERIEAENEALKKANEVFNDGSRKNDYGAYGEGILQTMQGQGATKADTNTATKRLEKAHSSGEDMTGAQLEARITYNGLLNQAAEQTQQLTAATNEYNDALARADLQEQNAEENHAAQLEMYGEMDGLLERYSALIYANNDAQYSWNKVMEESGEAMDPSALEAFSALLHDENGNLIADFSVLMEVYAQLQRAKEESGEQLESTKETIDQTRKDAQTALKQSVAGIADLPGLDANALDTALDLVEEAGVAVPEAARAAVVGVQQSIEGLSGALSQSGTDIATALNGALSEVSTLQLTLVETIDEAAKGAQTDAGKSGVPVGENFSKGVAEGIRNKIEAIARAAAQLVKDTVAAANQEADSHSPSRVMRDKVGVMLTRGVAVGIAQETPSAVKAIRNSTRQLVSGAAEMVRGSRYTAQLQIAGAAQPINYTAMGDALSQAMRRVKFGFSVDGVDLASAQREHNARQLAFQSRSMMRRYGG